MFGSQFFFAYLHSSGHNFMIFLSIFKNSGANNISRSPCIHFRGDNTAGDNQTQLWAHQMSVTLYMYLNQGIVLFKKKQAYIQQNLQLDGKIYCQKLPPDCHAASSVFSPEMDSTCSQLFPGSGFLKNYKKFAEIGAF